MKILLKLSITVITLLLLSVVLLLIFIDPNDYKTEIQDQVKTTINRDLHIKGDIGWTFFPQLGFSSGEVALDNAPGFNHPHLVKINKASLGINILPLFKGEISIGQLTLDGFEVTLLKNKNGLSNLDNMGKTAQKSAPSTSQAIKEESEEKAFLKINKTQLAGININNAIIEVEDLQTNSYQKITINEIKLGQFALDKETELSINTKVIIDALQAEFQLSALLLVSGDLATIKLNQLQLNSLLTTPALPNGQLSSQFNSEFTYLANAKKVSLEKIDIKTVVTGDNIPNKKVETQFTADVIYTLNEKLAQIKQLALNVDKIELTGEASVQTADITKVRYNLVGNRWDLNPYITQSEKAEEKETNTTNESDNSPTAPSETQPEIEPDLSFLNGLDIDGHLKIAGINIDKIKIEEVNKHLIIKNGEAQISPLTAQLYKGLFTLNATVSDNKGNNNYKVSTNLKGVEILPLLIDAAEVDLLSGTTQFNFTGTGQGLTATKIKEGIVGKGNFKLLDGELYGVNIPQEIRILKAKLTGQKAPTQSNIKKTDFASLAGDFTINEGVVNNQKLLMLSPIMRLDGSGLINILKESLDYKLSITPLSDSKEDTSYEALKGLTIPLLIEGTFSEPKFALDTDSALKEQLKAQLKEKTKALEKEAKAKLKEKLDAETKGKVKEESKKLEDKLKSFF